MKKEKTTQIKATIGNKKISYEIPEKLFQSRHESPHIHHSKSHPSNNVKFCDLCQKQMVRHYHVCEECFKFTRESQMKKLEELEKRVQELERRQPAESDA